MIDLISTAASAPRAQPRQPALPLQPAAQPVSEKSDRAAQALEVMRTITEAAPEERKALAREKLERLKEELLKLMQFGISPALTARRAAQIARDVGGAAGEFAAATRQTAAQETSNPATSASTQAAATIEAAPVAVPRAYLSVLEDASPVGTLSKDDQETIDSFRQFGQTLRDVLEGPTLDTRMARKTDPDFRSAGRALDGMELDLGSLERNVATGSLLLLSNVPRSITI